MKPSVSGKEGRDLSTIIGDQRVAFSLDGVRAEKQLERERRGYAFQARDPKDQMRLSLVDWRSSADECRSWQDSGDDRLENHLREIAVELIVAGEQHHRDSAIHHREWRIQRRAELEEEERKQKIEEERKRREHQAKLEQARVEHLLSQAAAMHRAEQIRAYVAAIRDANKTAPDPMSDEELNSWAKWALAQADRIDPVVSGHYKTRPREPEE
jgi:hypothetical protein